MYFRGLRQNRITEYPSMYNNEECVAIFLLINVSKPLSADY